MKIFMIAALLCLPLASLHSAEPAAPTRPNIIIIMADDLAYSDDSCLGFR